VIAADSGDAERREVVEREGLPRQELADPGLHPTERFRERDDQTLESELALHETHDLLERVDLRAAELVSAPERAAVLECRHERLRDVVHVDRRHPRVGARERQDRKALQELREPIREKVFGPENHGRLKDGERQVRASVPDRLLALPLLWQAMLGPPPP